MIRVVLVDDQALVRTGLRMVLEAEPDIEVVGEAADGLQAVEAARLRPDLVLIDIRMPNLDGIEATRRLAGPAVADPVRVLILTTYDADSGPRSSIDVAFDPAAASAGPPHARRAYSTGVLVRVRRPAGRGLRVPAQAHLPRGAGRGGADGGLGRRADRPRGHPAPHRRWAYEAGLVQPGR
jgi:CheY-like chemotaxis protein